MTPQLIGVRFGRGLPTSEQVNKAIQDLKSPDREIRASAALSLWKIGRDYAHVRPALIEALKDEDTFVRFNAAFALGQMDKFAAPATPHIVELLKDRDSGVRSSAANALRKMGLAAASTVPRLLELLTDEDSEVSGWAAYALGEIAPSIKKWLRVICDTDWTEGLTYWQMISGCSYSTLEDTLTQELILWQSALTSLNELVRKETPYPRTFSAAAANVRHLVNELLREKQAH